MLKFFSPRCVSCKAIRPKFERVAKSCADGMDFYEVDHLQARLFCKQCDVNFMPAAHVYHKGQLLHAVPIGSKSFGRFLQIVQELSNGNGPHTLTNDGASAAS